jgi:hypothetical protein
MGMGVVMEATGAAACAARRAACQQAVDPSAWQVESVNGKESRMITNPITIDERIGLLDAEVGRYVARGFTVASRSDFDAQLIKPKQFSPGWALFWLIFAIGVSLLWFSLGLWLVAGIAVPVLSVGGLIGYLLLYLAKTDEQVSLSVDEAGRVSAWRK